LLENATIRTLIGQVQAFDKDSNTTIHYELTCLDDQDVFDIDLLTGQLRTKALLDYEIHPLHRLYITAKDNNYLHSTRVTVNIQLIDINDNVPMIDPPSAIYIPSELLQTNVSVTIPIISISARDRDQGQYGNLTYQIVDGNHHGYFEINPINGTIVGQSLNLPQGHHRLMIKVCDQGQDKGQCSTTNVNIKIGEYVEKYFYSTKIDHQDFLKKKSSSNENETIFTREMIFVVLISTILTLVFSITTGILIAFFCKQKRCRHLHRSSLNKPCQLLQSTDADKLLTTTKKLNEHGHIEPYDDLKGVGSAASSEDSCYGSNELSRSSSSAHGVVRPLLTAQHRSSSLSSTSVDYAVPTHRQLPTFNSKSSAASTAVVVGIHQSMDNTDERTPTNSHQLKTFHSPAASSSSSSGNFTLKRTIQSLTRRPLHDQQSTYLTYDSIDTPPPPPPSTIKLTYHHQTLSTNDSTSREYSI